jgi:hypothetical protein
LGRQQAARGETVAIDGSKIGKQPQEKDVYQSPWLALIAQAMFWVPVLLIVWFAYWSGTWMGGPVWGFLSVLSTAATVGFLYLMMHRKKRR